MPLTLVHIQSFWMVYAPWQACLSQFVGPGIISVFPHTKASITAWCKKTYWSYTEIKYIPILLQRTVFDEAKFRKFVTVKLKHPRQINPVSSLPTKTSSFLKPWPFLALAEEQIWTLQRRSAIFPYISRILKLFKPHLHTKP